MSCTAVGQIDDTTRSVIHTLFNPFAGADVMGLCNFLDASKREDDLYVGRKLWDVAPRSFKEDLVRAASQTLFSRMEDYLRGDGRLYLLLLATACPEMKIRIMDVSYLRLGPAQTP